MFYEFLQAIEFVSMQHEDELWEELIKQCLNKPEMVSTKVIILTKFVYLVFEMYKIFLCFDFSRSR